MNKIIVSIFFCTGVTAWAMDYKVQFLDGKVTAPLTEHERGVLTQSELVKFQIKQGEEAIQLPLSSQEYDVLQPLIKPAQKDILAKLLDSASLEQLVNWIIITDKVGLEDLLSTLIAMLVVKLQDSKALSQFLATYAGKIPATLEGLITQAVVKSFNEKDLLQEVPFMAYVLKHDELISSVAFSPNGKYLAIDSKDKIVRIWEISTSKPLRTLQYKGQLSSLVFSPNGKYLAAGSDDTTAKMWEVSTGNLRTPKHARSVVSVAFSPDGKYLATGSQDDTAKIWEVATGNPVHSLEHDDWIKSVVFSPDGKYLATDSKDNTVRIWKVATGKIVHILRHGRWVRSVAFSPDSNYLATCSEDNTAKIWKVATGKEEHIFKHNSSVYAVVFSLDGKYLFTASDDKIIKMWEVSTGKSLHDLIHFSRITSVALSPDGKYLATGSADGNTKIWEIATGKLEHILKHDGWIRAVTFSPDGKYLAVFGNKIVKIWRLEPLSYITYLMSQKSSNYLPQVLLINAIYRAYLKKELFDISYDPVLKDLFGQLPKSLQAALENWIKQGRKRKRI